MFTLRLPDNRTSYPEHKSESNATLVWDGVAKGRAAGRVHLERLLAHCQMFTTVRRWTGAIDRGTRVVGTWEGITWGAWGNVDN
jgi:hypothetical protein